ncbi:MAG: magnesium transporter [Eubacteriales bacterium]|nr:magnesium transporter [Eubacteriales bacterium]
MNREMIAERLNEMLGSGRHSQLRGALTMLTSVDIALYLSELDREKMLLVYRILPKDVAAEVFSYLESDKQRELIEIIGDAEIHSLLEEMYLDDTIDFLEELPAGVVRRVLMNADEQTRELINQFLRYPENSAGSIMTIEYCEFHTPMTVREAFDEIRRTGLDKETIYTLYVIDERRRLQGTVPLRRLILSPAETPVSELMTPNPVRVRTLDDQEIVAEKVRRYDLMAIPVVDDEDRLVGIVTADDIMDVIEEENTEDFEKMAAMTPADDTYLKTPVMTLVKNRMPWLLLLMFSAMFTGLIITRYEGLLVASGAIGVALTSCMPMLMGTGGNCGSQASTLTIRGLALGEIQPRDVGKLIWKELRVALIVGVILAALNILRLVFLNGFTWGVALSVGIALFLTVILAKALGCALPVLAKLVKLDPALMASPILATIVDALSLVFLFVISSHILHI